MFCTQVALNLTHHFVLSNRCLAVKYQNNIVYTFCNNQIANQPPQMGFEYGCGNNTLKQQIITLNNRVIFYDKFYMYNFNVESQKLIIKQLQNIQKVAHINQSHFMVLISSKVYYLSWKKLTKYFLMKNVNSISNNFIISQSYLYYITQKPIMIFTLLTQNQVLEKSYQVQDHIYFIVFNTHQIILDFERFLLYNLQDANVIDQYIQFVNLKIKTQQHSYYQQQLYSLAYFYENQLKIPQLPQGVLFKIKTDEKNFHQYRYLLSSIVFLSIGLLI